MNDRRPSEREAVTDALGSGTGRSTKLSPPERVHAVTLYLSSKGRLATQPEAQEGYTAYRVDPSESTGKQAHHRLGLPPVEHDSTDWNGGLDRLCTFVTPPAARVTEITGYIELSVVMSATAKEGGLFAYLEDVDPHGQARYITDGVLRLGFVASSTAEATGTTDQKNVLQSDLKLLPSRTIRTVEMMLKPISWHIQEGHRIRLALGGTDSTSIRPLPVGEKEEFVFHHGSIHPSALRLTLGAPTWD